MAKLIFILGGARSGKSCYAVKVAGDLSYKVAYIATCTNPDAEMRQRIRLHRSSRPRQWRLIEEGSDISSILPKLKGKYKVVLIDCLGLLISNLLSANLEEKEIEMRLKKVVKTILSTNLITVLVSNETGCGIVPENALARRFRDLLGLANQMFAEKADEVIFMQSGIPIRIKGEKAEGRK